MKTKGDGISWHDLLAIGLTSLGLIVAGCADMIPYTSSKKVPERFLREVAYGEIATPGVTIREINGKFELKNGERFTPPFQASSLYYDTGNSKLVFWFGSSQEEKSKIVSKYDSALKVGAHKVLVETSWTKEPLHGILYLGLVHERAYGPAANSYRIEVPENYALAAARGETSVIYEKTKFKFWYPVDAGWEEADDFAWILWLNKEPIGHISYQSIGAHWVVTNTSYPMLNYFWVGNSAYESGLRLGDRLLSVNGMSKYGSLVETFSDGFKSNQGDINQLKVKRGEQTLEFDVPVVKVDY